MALPDDYIGTVTAEGTRIPKAFEELTDEQQREVTVGQYRCLKVHPTQLYSSTLAILATLFLYLFWRRARNTGFSLGESKLFTKPGSTFGLMLIVYGLMRFPMEYVRDDNPYEMSGLTVSQLIACGMIAFGACLMILVQVLKAEKVAPVWTGLNKRK